MGHLTCTHAPPVARTSVLAVVWSIVAVLVAVAAVCILSNELADWEQA